MLIISKIAKIDTTTSLMTTLKELSGFASKQGFSGIHIVCAHARLRISGNKIILKATSF